MERLSQPKLGPAADTAGGVGVNGQTVQVAGPAAAPQTEAEKVAAEVARRRRLITSGAIWNPYAPKEEQVTQASREGLGQRADGRAGFEDAPPDVADLAIKDLQTGRVRRARQGSSSSALGAFSVSSALGADSLLGN